MLGQSQKLLMMLVGKKCYIHAEKVYENSLSVEGTKMHCHSCLCFKLV